MWFSGNIQGGSIPLTRVTWPGVNPAESNRRKSGQ
nr:MAG TPA: hypothetical protein [Caudoviricetes sp.]DAZ19137.1 MAG TPA: hypothetical protein [Caudoviricetes sp.]